MAGSYQHQLHLPPRGPRLTPGKDISDSRRHTCSKCKAAVLLGRVRDEMQTLKWRNFDLPPVQRGPHYWYRRHFCPR